MDMRELNKKSKKLHISPTPGALTLAGSNWGETGCGGECDSAVRQGLTIVLVIVLVELWFPQFVGVRERGRARLRNLQFPLSKGLKFVARQPVENREPVERHGH